jgi:hypothetical protein
VIPMGGIKVSIFAFKSLFNNVVTLRKKNI